MIIFTLFSTLCIFTLQYQQCTHISGNYLVGRGKNYGTTGHYSHETTPGGIHSPKTFLIKRSNETEIFMFFGYGSSGSSNEIWKYSLKINQWAFVKGKYGSNSYFTETNVFSTESLIGERYYFDGWINDDIVFFFGGMARFRSEDRSGLWVTTHTRSNEIWRYNISSNLYSVSNYNYLHTDSGYTWYLGQTNTNCFAIDESFGEFHPNNVPGGREKHITVAFSDTQTVLLGGKGFNRVLGDSNNFLEDTWIFDAILLQWKHVGGNIDCTYIDESDFKHSITLGTTNVYSPDNNYGKRSDMQGVLMNDEEVLFFGGYGFLTTILYLNMVQKFNTTSYQYKYLSGTKIQPSMSRIRGTGYFREYGIENNYPGGRVSHGIVKVNEEEIILVGGYGYASSYNGRLNDEWWFNTKSQTWKFTGKELTKYTNRFQISTGDVKTIDLLFGGISSYASHYLKDSNELLILMGYGYDKYKNGNFNDIWSVYYGNECFILKDSDPTVCLGRGKCIGNNICECNDGFYGEMCELTKCNGILSNETSTVCSGKGICVGSKCACYISSSYNRPDCTLDIEQQIIDEERQEMLENLWIYFTIPIVSVIILFILTALSIIILFIGCKLFKILQKFKGIDDVDLILNEAKIEQNNSNPKIKVDSSLFEVNIKDIKLIKLIGEGGSQTSVFLAEWKGNPCAYKSFKIASMYNSASSYEEFEREVKLNSSINHPSILQFYGACINPPNIGILLQFCKFGDISSYYSKIKYVEKKRIPISEKLRILKEISSGMQYLHSINVIHRDLKPENVLIDNNKNSKIMDFGLSKLVSSEEKTMTKQIGTSFYMAPEVFKAGEQYSDKCDVYSFAILAYVLISENFFPYGAEANQSMILKKVSKNPNFRPKIEEKDFRKCKFLIDLIKKNWDQNPEQRNSFEEIERIIQNQEKKILFHEQNRTKVTVAKEKDEKDIRIFELTKKVKELEALLQQKDKRINLQQLPRKKKIPPMIPRNRPVKRNRIPPMVPKKAFKN